MPPWERRRGGGCCPEGRRGSVSRAAKGEDGVYRLAVTGLPREITDRELKTVFATYGPVSRVKILNTEDIRVNKGDAEAVVCYAKRISAQNAIELLDQKYKIRKRAEHPIRVTWAQSGEAETSSQSEYEESNPGARHCFFGLSGRCASEKANPTTVSLYARSRSYQDRPV